MILFSLLTNIAVLIPVCAGLLLDSPWIAEAYGDASAARSILLSVYGAILAVSVWLLFQRQPMLVAALLLVQVVYKVTTPLTVGSFTNPVVISNLIVAAVHLTTLFCILRTEGRTPAIPTEA